MSNLTPEVRVNKNGVPVTKHVLPVQSASASGTSIPAPESPPDASVMDHTELAENAAMAVAGTLAGFGNDPDEEIRLRCHKAFVKFSYETLLAVNSYCQDADSFEEAIYPYDCIDVLVSAGGNESQLLHLMALVDVLGGEMALTDTDEVIARSLAMTTYDRYLDARPEASGDRSEYYAVLAKATAALEEAWNEADVEPSDDMYDDDDSLDPAPPIMHHVVLSTDVLSYSTPLIDDQAMIKLLLDNVDRGDEIVDFITERSTFDAGFIADYLTGSHRSLAEGTL